MTEKGQAQAEHSSNAGGDSWLEKTLTIAQMLYEDHSVGPIALDLHSACAIGNYGCVQEAINRQEDLSTRNKGGWTPLMYASYVGHDTVVNLLLEAGADPNIGTVDGLTSLMVAAGCGNESVCFFLIGHGAEINRQDGRGCTALYHATKQGHQNAVQVLLKEGADLSIGDYQNGYTPLMIAALEGDQIVIDVLMSCSTYADVTAKAKDGHTARSLALKNNHLKTVSFLDEVQMLYMDRTRPSRSTTSDTPSTSSFADDDDDLHSGPDEVERHVIRARLGSRSGARWSLPPEYNGLHRNSMSNAAMRRLRFKAALSLPESNESQWDYEEDEDLLEVESYEESMQRLAEFLRHIGLEKYLSVFEEHEIEFNGMLELNDADLRKLFDKVGPRKKLQNAIQQLREQEGVLGTSAGSRDTPTTPTPRNTSGSNDIHQHSHRQQQSQLELQLKQLQTQCQQAAHALESCEQRLAKEHELRLMADGYLRQLQQGRAQIVEANSALRDSVTALTRHCKSAKATYSSLSKATGSLVQGYGGDAPAVGQVCSSVKQLGGELEAISHSVVQVNQDCKSLNYHITGFSS